MGIFSNSGQPEFLVHSWLINFILQRIIQGTDENKGPSLPMFPLRLALVPLDPIALILNDKLRVQHGKVWLLEHLHMETSGHRERFEKTRRERGRMGLQNLGRI